MAGVLPMLAMPTTRDLSVETVMSLLDTKQACCDQGIQLVTCIVQGASMGAFDGRNRAAHEFLKAKPCTHIFWIDSDMSWQAADFLRLLALADKMPFIAAAGPLKREERKFAYRLEKDQEIRTDKYGCIKLKGVGLAFACIQRSVMENVAKRAPTVTVPNGNERIPYIFRCEVSDGDLMGEDVRFCEDIASLGYDINIDPHVVLGHIGTKEYKHGCVADTWRRVSALEKD